MQQMFYIAHLISCSTCFGHHYAHHQELESIIQLVAACGLCCLVFKLSVRCGAEGCVSGLRAAALLATGNTTLSPTPSRQLENQAPKNTGGNQRYNTLEFLMMGIMVPETC
jgi:cell division protein FtsX